MKFNLTLSCNWLNISESVDKYNGLGFVVKNHLTKSLIRQELSGTPTIEIDTINDLINLIQKVEEEIIIRKKENYDQGPNNYTIEIYNGYRE